MQKHTKLTKPNRKLEFAFENNKLQTKFKAFLLCKKQRCKIF